MLIMSEGNIEVEIKVPLSSDDFEYIRDSILKLGGKYLNSESQQDTYYDHPCRAFQETDEAVRVRQRIPSTNAESQDDHPLLELAYKGPKLDVLSKTRLELSIGITDAAIAKSILKELSFREVATIIKKRDFFKYGLSTICIDDVEDVGVFIELERLVSTEEELEPARNQLLEIIKNLGLDSNKSIRESYLELYLANRNQ